MCRVDPKVRLVICLAGIGVFAVLSLCSVGFPGWAVREEDGGTVNVGLFFTCFNGTFFGRHCVARYPFGNAALDVTTKFLVITGAGFQIIGVYLAVYHSCCFDRRWSQPFAQTVTFVVSGGLMFFVGCICGLGFVLLDGRGQLRCGPALLLGLAASAMSINLGCLVSIFERSIYDPYN